MGFHLRAGIAVGLTLAIVACGGPEERKAKHRLNAQEYINEGNFPKARVALRNVLKIDPKDAEAYFLFAQVEEKERNWRNAFANYQRVVELVPEHERAQLRLAKFYLEARMIDRVSELAWRVLEKNPDNVQAASLRIAVEAVNGHLPEAIQQGETLVAAHPVDPDATLLLATLYVAQGRAGEAEAVLRKTLDAEPSNLEVLDGLASILRRNGQADRAEGIYQRLVALEPRVFDHRVKLVQFYDQQKAFGKAEALLREAVQLEPDSEMRRLRLAEYLMLRGKGEQVEAALQDAQRQLPHATKLPLALAGWYESQGRLDQARAIYVRLCDENKKEPVALEAKVKLASLDLAEGKETEAERQLQEVLRENPRSAEGLMLQGKVALKRENGKDAIQAFRSVLKDQPELVEGHVLLGRAHLSAGETTLARDSFERAASLNPAQADVQIVLAGMDVMAGHPVEARQRLEIVLAREPQNLQALDAMFRLQVAGQDWTQTEVTLGRLRNAGAGQAWANMTEGSLHQAKKEWDQAITAYERALAAAPRAPEPLIALVQIDQMLGRGEKAQARLETAAEDDGHPYAHGFLGELLMQKHDAAGANEHFLAATRINPKWSMPWLHLATLRLAEKRLSDAQTVLRKGLVENPDGQELRMVLATTLTEAGEVDEAMKEYETILKNSPKASLAANNLAALLVDRKGDRQSLERALALSKDFERQAPNPFFIDTLGWVHLKLGHQEEAIRVMQLAVQRAPAHPVLNYHLGAAYAKSGRDKEARGYLEKALSAEQTFIGKDDARSLLAGLNG
jgi:tetratricopeptide (TPR) repeat protein